MRTNYKKMINELVESINSELKEQGLKMLYLSRATLYDYNKMFVIVPLDCGEIDWYRVSGGYRFKNNKEAYQYLDFDYSIDQLMTHLYDQNFNRRSK